MSPVPRETDDWLSTQEKVSRKGTQRWRDASLKRIYEYDDLHGHIEVYNQRGKHIGVASAETGEMFGDPVPGRSIDV